MSSKDISKYKAQLQNSEVSMSDKINLTFYLPKQTLIKIEALQSLTVKSRNEIVAAAIDQYFGSVTTGLNQAYLCDTYGTEFKATIEQSESLIRKNIYRLSVEIAMLNQLVAGDNELTNEEYQTLRAAAIKEVNKLRGE